MNKIIDYQGDSSITQEACAWVVQLDGDEPPSAEDLKALREWMGRSRAHRDEIARLAGLWGKFNLLSEMGDVPFRAAEKPVQRSRRVPGRVRLMAAAAVVLAYVGLFFMYAPGLGDAGQASYSTMVGEQREVKLPDGSVLLLNTDSTAVVAFSPLERRVSLTRGEAHFDVHRDPARPFVVQAGDGLVRAVGTAFSVRLREARVEVSITEGAVELATLAPAASTMGAVANTLSTNVRPRKLAVVAAGHRAQFDSQIKSITDVSAEKLAEQLAWRHGMLVFSGERLDSVIREVSRYTTQSIEFDDPSLAELRIGGQFRLGETEALFKALENGFGVDVQRQGTRVVLSMARPPQHH